MSALQELYDALQKQPPGPKDYGIPASWNYLGVPSAACHDRPNEVWVSSLPYFTACLESILSHAHIIPKAAIDIRELVLYAMMPRTFSAWPHRDGHTIENGTLLKCICLLPLLREMGVNAVYLLPIFSVSHLFQKGELPSPYSIRDLRAIDEALCDPHLGAIPAATQFQAFVEACHRLGMRVLLDFVLRSVARDNVLLYNHHPDWFYWIDAKQAADFAAPKVPGLGHENVNADNVHQLYEAPDMPTFLGAFVPPPTAAELAQAASQAPDPDERPAWIAERLGKMTMPGFADTLNDPQPPWTDITFLRMYFDNTAPATAYAKERRLPPVLAQDGVKCNLFPGTQPNTALWEYLADIIPYFRDTYHIDGARIDMAHALPGALTKQMIARMKEATPGFILWSEEFISANAEKAKAEGYDLITGGIWDQWSRFAQADFNPRLLECLHTALPAAAFLEMPDTPRSALYLSRDQRICALLLAALLPGSLMAVNNGQELGEIQPMNLGLKNTREGRYVLPKAHPLYGKLAFFDRYYFNWTCKDPLNGYMAKAAQIRSRFLRQIENPACYQSELLRSRRLQTYLIAFDGEEGFACLVNRGKRPHDIDPFPLLLTCLQHPVQYSVFYRHRAAIDRLEPGGVLILHLRKGVHF